MKVEISKHCLMPYAAGFKEGRCNDYCLKLIQSECLTAWIDLLTLLSKKKRLKHAPLNYKIKKLKVFLLVKVKFFTERI